MPMYHVSAELPDFNEEVAALVPRHRAYIEKLLKEEKLMSYSVSAGANALWCVLSADDEQAAMQLIAEMPMQHYFTDVHCTRLLFHQGLQNKLPAISLN